MSHKKVESIEQIKKLVKEDGGHEFFVWLNHGLRSSKHISFDGKKYHIENGIDGSRRVISEKTMLDPKKSIIGEALIKDVLYQY